jgi:hypothetical protein
MASRHQRGAEASAFLTTRYTRANEQQPFLCQRLAATVGVKVLGVATVNDDVTLLKMRYLLTTAVGKHFGANAC